MRDRPLGVTIIGRVSLVISILPLLFVFAPSSIVGGMMGYRHPEEQIPTFRLVMLSVDILLLFGFGLTGLGILKLKSNALKMYASSAAFAVFVLWSLASFAFKVSWIWGLILVIIAVYFLASIYYLFQPRIKEKFTAAQYL